MKVEAEAAAEEVEEVEEEMEGQVRAGRWRRGWWRRGSRGRRRSAASSALSA